MSIASKFREILSGEIFSNPRIVKRIPVLVVGVLLIVSYIGAGYNMKELKERENNLLKTYRELHATYALLHKKVQDETSIECIKKLITKYNLDYLKLELSPTNPIEIKND